MGTKLRASLAAVAVLGATAGMAAGGSGAAFADTTAPGGTWGSAQAIPGLDALVYTGGGYDPSSVSNIGCSTPGNCVAIGSYDGPDNISPAPFAATEVNGTWGTQPIAGLPAETVSSPAGYHAGVSCGQPDFCTAFGTYMGTAGVQIVFAVTETGGTWGTPNILDTTALGDVQSIGNIVQSCPAAGECAIAGSYTLADGTAGPFTADESGGHWGALQPLSLASLQPAGSTGVTGSLGVLSCGAPGDCTASGFYEGTPYQYNTNPQPFTVTEAGHTWGAPQPVPGLASLSPNGADSARGNVNEITSISCPDAGDCAAVGTFYPQPDSVGSLFTLDEAGGTWGQAQALSIPPSGSIAGNPSGYVACRSAGDCVIAATVPTTPAMSETVAAAESSSGAWGTATDIPGTTAADEGLIHGLTCVPAGDCTAYGTSYPGGKYPGEIFSATEPDGGAMGTAQQAATLPNNWPLNLGMACPQNGQCTAAFNDQQSFGAIPQVVTEGTPVTAGPVPTVTLTVPSTMYYGQSPNLTVTVSSAAGSTPLGTVTVAGSAGSICMIRLAGGTGSCPLSGAYLFFGANTLTAAYSGDPEHQPATGTATVTFDQNATVTHLAFTPGSVTFTGAGTTLTVSGTVSSAVGTPSGIATVLVDGKAVSGCINAEVDLTGKLSCKGTTAVLSAGRHLVTLSYSAEGGFLASTSAPLPLTVSKRGTTTTLAPAKASVTYGRESAEKFTVSVSRAGSVYPTGKVAVRIGATTICTITLSKGTGGCVPANTRLRAGTYTLAALYSGDGNYAPSWSAKKNLKVTR